MSAATGRWNNARNLMPPRRLRGGINLKKDPAAF
jgi:hypothetical protein